VARLEGGLGGGLTEARRPGSKTEAGPPPPRGIGPPVEAQGVSYPRWRYFPSDGRHPPWVDGVGEAFALAQGVIDSDTQASRATPSSPQWPQPS
jgi:hypothetical protein